MVLITVGIVITTVVGGIAEIWKAEIPIGDDKEESLLRDAELILLIDEGYFKMLISMIGAILLLALVVFTNTVEDFVWLQIISIVILNILSFLLLWRAKKSNGADMALYGLLPVTFWNLGMLGYVMYYILKEGSFRNSELNSFFAGIVLIECWLISTIYKLLRFRRNSQPTINE
jgi:uncharacterized membrane protein